MAKHKTLRELLKFYLIANKDKLVNYKTVGQIHNELIKDQLPLWRGTIEITLDEMEVQGILEVDYFKVKHYYKDVNVKHYRFKNIKRTNKNE